MAYDYLYEIGYHKSFRNHLYDQQNEEDKLCRDSWIKSITDEFLKNQADSFKSNPNLFSMPIPELKMFEGCEPLQQNSGATMRFTRPSKEDQIKWQSAHVESLKQKLNEATNDLEKLTNE
jgi:hypothetical protein